MGIFNNIINGASSQFGREFGRAAANSILKGKNSYTVNSNNYNERIKPSDSDIVKAIKDLKKIQFVTTDKANISRLIDMTNMILPFFEFKGIKTLEEINDVKVLLETYNQKAKHGEALLSKDNNSNEKQYFDTLTKECENKIDKFNSEVSLFVKDAQKKSLANKKNKWITVLLSFIFFLGVHNFYLGLHKKGIFSIIGLLIPFWNIYVLIRNIIESLSLLFMSQDKFDIAYNTDYVYFCKFSFN